MGKDPRHHEKHLLIRGGPSQFRLIHISHENEFMSDVQLGSIVNTL